MFSRIPSLGLWALSLCVGAHLVLVPPAQAQALAFVKATQPGSAVAAPPAAENLVDHLPNTLWCVTPADSDAAAPSVQFVFKHPVKIDRIVVTKTGAEAPTPLQMTFRNTTGQVEMLSSRDQTSEYRLTHALQGTAFTLQVRRGGPGKNTDPICLAEVALFDQSQELTGASADAGDHVPQPRATELVGRWAASPLGASEATLVIANDGTWSLIQEPLQGAAAGQLAGTYRVVHGRLSMRLGTQGKWMRVQVERRRVAIDPTDLGAPAADYDTLKLSGSLPAALVGTFNNAQF
jgi:hypothetical protein